MLKGPSAANPSDYRDGELDLLGLLVLSVLMILNERFEHLLPIHAPFELLCVHLSYFLQQGDGW